MPLPLVSVDRAVPIARLIMHVQHAPDPSSNSFSNESSTFPSSPRTTTSPTRKILPASNALCVEVLVSRLHYTLALGAEHKDNHSAALLVLSGTAAAISNVVPSWTSSGGTLKVTWDADSTDTKPITIALVSKTPSTYNGALALANNVNPQDKEATIQMPDVYAGPGYTVAMLSMDDTGAVIAESSPFAIASAGASPPPTATPPTPTSATFVPVSAAPTLSHISLSVSTVSISVVSSVSKPASVTHSGSASASASVHSGSASGVSGSASASAPKPTSTAPLSLSASAIRSAASSALSSIASRATSEVAASASASARSGAVPSRRVPTAGLGLALALGLLAWAL
ncbi:hypothetical protein DFH06DRAFT_1428750 [Mycena polygramma]|nr:hypothetical protein DFH06DRAFT_1428750 [Mycena polygramma]